MQKKVFVFLIILLLMPIVIGEDNATCSDGTKSDFCSTTKPYFCNQGNLEQNCGKCGCLGDNEICDISGSCVKETSDDYEICLVNGLCETEFGETSENCPQDCYCGDGICDLTEDALSCDIDCNPQVQGCGNGLCETNEDAYNCSIDCSNRSELIVDYAPLKEKLIVMLILAVFAIWQVVLLGLLIYVLLELRKLK